jgi:hypothetical protein
MTVRMYPRGLMTWRFFPANVGFGLEWMRCPVFNAIVLKGKMLQGAELPTCQQD